MEPGEARGRPTLEIFNVLACQQANISDRVFMTNGDYLMPSQMFVPGEVLALLTPLQELDAGLYLLYLAADDWVVLRWLIDDEKAERIIVTERESRLPASLLKLFMPVGITLSSVA